MGMAKKEENAAVTLAASYAEQRRLKALSRAYLDARVRSLMTTGEYSLTEVARMVGKSIDFVRRAVDEGKSK